MSTLIGSGADQVPTNGLLGTCAFQDNNAVNISGGVISGTLSGASGVVAIGNSGTSKTVAWVSGNYQSITLDNNCTIIFDFAGCPVGRYLLTITQDGTGSRTVTWSTGTPGTTKWVGVVGAPSLNSAASSVSISSFYYDGTNAYGSLARVNAL